MVEDLATKVDAMDKKLTVMASLLTEMWQITTASESGKMAELALPDLPAKLWEKIFTSLDTRDLTQVRLTCHRWKNVVDKSLVLRERFSVNFPGHTVMDRDYYPTSLLSPGLRASFRKARIIAVDQWWPSLGESLVHLSFSDCKMLLSTFLGMLRQTPKLKCLTLVRMKFPEKESTREVGYQLNEMEQLTLVETNVEEGFEDIFTQLKEFKLRMSEPRANELDVAKMVRLIGSVQHTLEKVQLRYQCEIMSELATMKDLRLKHVEFYISSKTQKGDTTAELIKLCSSQPSIEELLLPTDVEVTTENLAEIGIFLPGLKLLRATTTQEQNDNKFLAAMPRLVNLGWHSSAKVDLTSSANPNLRHLHLRSQQIQNASLRHYLRQSPQLRSVTLSHCRFESWTAVFDALSPCRSLHRLRLSSLAVAHADDETLLEYFDSVRYLELDELPMSKAVLKLLVRLCPQLQELELKRMAQVDVEVARFACRRLRHLKRLIFEGCPNIGEIEAHRDELECLEVKSDEGQVAE